MKNFKIKIPKPCNEGWDKMTPNEKGRFCDSCSKTVIDFTKKSHKEIKEYFIANKGNRICGHFRKSQLDSIVIQIPQETFQYNLSFQKLFLLALLLSMGSILFSCKTDRGTQKIDKIEINEYRFNRTGNDKSGYDDDGYNIAGYDKSGYDDDGYNVAGYDEDGYDENGYDENGYDIAGYNEDDVEDVLEGEPAYYSPEVPPKYEMIKTKIIQLLNTKFKDEVKNKNVKVGIFIHFEREIEVEPFVLELNIKGNKKQEIIAQLKLKIIPLIVAEVKKEKEYDYFRYVYNLKF